MIILVYKTKKFILEDKASLNISMYVLNQNFLWFWFG